MMLLSVATGIVNGVASVFSFNGSEAVEEEMQSHTRSQSVTPTPPSRSAQRRTLRSHQDPPKKTTAILLLGASGSGKTLFFERAFAKGGSVRETTPFETTVNVLTGSTRILGNKFTLIDTPGFDNPAMTDLEAFSKLANHLLNKASIQDGITGIVYIHRAGDRLRSKTLIQSMHVFSDVFLGKSGLSRLTILVVPDGLGNTVHAPAEQAVIRSNAFRAACDLGAKVVVSTLEQSKIKGVLAAYVSEPPIRLRIQRKYLDYPQTDFKRQIEERLKYYKKDLSDDHAHVVEAQLKEKDLKIESLETSLRERDSQVSQLSNDYKQAEQQMAHSLQMTLKLQRDHQKTQDEYASLRSQLQLQENIEQSQLVQALKDLNRDIDSIGRSIAEYLVENYVQSVFGKDATEITALDAIDLPALMEPFNYVKGRSSLISSSSGVGMPVEDFLDYAIRYLICRHLHITIFAPFHPGVHPDENDFIGRLYDDVREREAQAVAGKWRADSFKCIYKPENDEATTHRIETIALEIVQDSLEVLIEYFFGQEAGIQLDNQYLKRLTQLVQTAWEWNATLKGAVILLGDFIITFYPPTSTYDPTQMSEFEPRLRSQTPKSILGTLALGLTCSRSLGHGQAPERTVVYKAMVATRNLYE